MTPYYTRHFTDADKTDKWAHIVAPATSTSFGVVDKREASGPTPIHSALNTFATLLSPHKTLEHNVVPGLTPSVTTKKVYLQAIQTSGYNPRPSVKDGKTAALIKITLGGQEATIGEGNGLFIDGSQVGDKLTVENVSDTTAEVLLFEMD